MSQFKTFDQLKKSRALKQIKLKYQILISFLPL